MEQITNIFNVDFKTVFLGIVAILLFFVALIGSIEKFSQIINKPVKWIKSKNDDHKKLEEVVRLSKENTENIDKLTKNLEELKNKRYLDVKEFKNCDKQLEKDLIEKEEELQRQMKQFTENRKRDREQSLQIQKELTDAIGCIYKTLAEIKKDMSDKDIADLRWIILKFATDLSNGKIASRESYDYIFSCYVRYENVLEENGKTNGLINESIDYIKEKYHEQLQNGTIHKK